MPRFKKKYEKIILENVEIESAGAEGKAIARVNGQVVFIPWAVPGDIVDLQLFKSKKNYAEGKILALKKASPLRISPKCSHFGICGGCQWQHMVYNEQLKVKQQQVLDQLNRIGGIAVENYLEIEGGDVLFEYRNKLEFSFSTKRWLTAEELSDDTISFNAALGFHVPGFFDKILHLDHCYLMDQKQNSLRKWFMDYALSHELSFYDARLHQGFLRNLLIRNSTLGNWLVAIVVSDYQQDLLFPMLEQCQLEFPWISSLHYIVNQKRNDSMDGLEAILFSGQSSIEEKLGNLRYSIQALSFFQTNTAQAEKLYERVRLFGDFKGNENVYDLYTGTGSIALYIASFVKKIVGVEYVESAVEDARKNAIRNNIDNARFVSGDLAKIFTDEFVEEFGPPDCIITDPPRSGMHEKVVQKILSLLPSKIIYVSCNPATQARDLAMMNDKYRVMNMQTFDMFPHTHHVENVVQLILK